MPAQPPSDPPAGEITRAVVVGAGYMGSGFAQLLALAGLRVTLVDVSAEDAAAGRERAITEALRFERSGLLPAGSAERVGAQTSASAAIAEATVDAELVLEAVSEDPAVKHAVLASVDAAAPAGCVIATNTSAIPIRDLAARMARPERFLGAHFFNPPQWVPGVEVIPHATTAPDVVERMIALLARLGKDPVVVGDSAGFVGNRIQFAMFKEAAAVVAEGLATPEEVDRVVRSSFGFRLPFFGPFAIADMAGLDVYAGAYETLEREHGERFAPPASLRALVDEGRLGTKSGGGYADRDADEIRRLAAERDGAYAALGRLMAERATPTE